LAQAQLSMLPKSRIAHKTEYLPISRWRLIYAGKFSARPQLILF